MDKDVDVNVNQCFLGRGGYFELQICDSCKQGKYLQIYPNGCNEPVQQQSRWSGLVGLQWVVKYDRGGARGVADGMECFGEPPHRTKKSIMGYVAHVALLPNKNVPKQSYN